MSNHRSSCNGDSVTTGCIVRIYFVGHYLLLFSQHVADICAKGLCNFLIHTHEHCDSHHSVRGPKLNRVDPAMSSWFAESNFLWFSPDDIDFLFRQVIEVIRHPHDKPESKYNPEAVSKEDEERYQKLLCENEELQRLIVQVCRRFYWLHGQCNYCWICFSFQFAERG